MSNTGGLNVTQTRRTGWQALFGASGAQYDFGGLSDVSCQLKLTIDPIVIPSAGKAPLGGRIVGLEGKVAIVTTQPVLAAYQASLPWYTSGAIGLTPASLPVDEYTYANLFTLHPINGASGVTEDINLIRAIPHLMEIKHPGDKDSLATIEFVFYPDRDQLPSLVYGYLGAPPS